MEEAKDDTGPAFSLATNVYTASDTATRPDTTFDDDIVSLDVGHGENYMPSVDQHADTGGAVEKTCSQHET